MSKNSWLNQKERGTVLGMRIVLWMIRFFGIKLTQFCLLPVVFYFYLTGKKARLSSLDFLKTIHFFSRTPNTKPTFWNGFFHFLSFTHIMLDKFLLWQDDSFFEFDSRGEEQLLKYLSEGKGCFIVGAHFGNFEMLRVLSIKQKIVVNAVMHLDNATEFNKIMKLINPNVSLNIINLKDRNIEAMFELKDAIARGEVVALLADRFYPTSRDRTVTLPFLGRDARFPANPWVIAHLLEAPLFFAAGVKSDTKKYTLKINLISERIKLPRKTREKDIEKLIGKYVLFLEELCVEYPYQWFNFYDFWSKDDK